jgi:RHS repeat-associated protein
VTGRYDFDPYGTPMAGSSTLDSRFGYAGQYTDAASGLSYLRARWYDPHTGALISRDPIRLASGETNLYRYAAGDPANATDPSGLSIFSDAVNGIAGWGDTLTFGLTSQIRQTIGNDNVDYCSSAYSNGGMAGLATSIVIPGPSEARLAIQATKEEHVIAETLAARGNITSAHTLSAGQALSAGERWLGDGYRELGKPGSGVFRSADDARQFRIDSGSLGGDHAPRVPHVHLEGYSPGAARPHVNNHIPFVDGP